MRGRSCAGGGTGIRSATTILPAYQHPQTGDPLPLSVAAALVYGTVRLDSCMVWRSKDVPADGVFIWELVPIDAGHTRLISRIRWSYAQNPWLRVLNIFTEFADHVAVRKILQGVRDRVEGRPPEPLSLQAVEISGWFLAFVEFCVATVAVAFSRYWKIAWLFALGTGAMLDFTLYSDAPIWFCAPMPWFYLGLAIVYWRRAKLKCPQRLSPCSE